MVAKRRLKINVTNILYFLILIPFIRVRTMEDFPLWLQDFYNYSAVISSTIILFYTLTKKNIKYTKNVLPIIIMMITYILITMLNNFDNIDKCYHCIFFIAICLFINIELNKNTYDIIKALTFIYTTLIVLNNVLVIIYPKGFYDANAYHNGHLLGDDNAIIYVALPGMIILTIYSLIKNDKISKFTWVNLIFCEIIFIKLWAASAIISFAVFIILISVGTKIIKLSPLTLFTVLFVFCSILFIGFNLPFITNFITNYLHKDITFSGRTYLWKNAVTLFKKKPILGYGGYFVAGRSYLGNRLYPVHTTHLQILVDGGLILFSEYITIIVLAFKKLNTFIKSNISQVLSAGIIAICISYTFEQAGLYHIIILITFALNIDKIVDCKNNKEKDNDNEGTVC